MTWFSFDLKKLLIFVFVIGLPLVSINFQRAPGETPWYITPIQITAQIIESGYSGFRTGIQQTTSEYLNLISIKRENRSLRQELQELGARLADFEEVRTENERLNKLLGFQARSKSKLVPARVTGYDLLGGSTQHSTIRINRGESEGVLRGQAVITPDGAVGTVFSVGPTASQVLLTTDRYSVVDGIVARSRARGIVEGQSPSSLKLKYLQRTDDVAVGDLVVTSGLDHIFPQGLPLARVVQIEKKAYGITQKVELAPVVDPSRIEELFVVVAAEESTSKTRTPAPTSTEK